MSAYRGWETQKKAYRRMYHPLRHDVIEERKMARLEEAVSDHRPLLDMCKVGCAFLGFFLVIGAISGALPDIVADVLDHFSSNRLLIGIIIGLVAFLFSYIKKRDAHDIEEMEVRTTEEVPEQHSRTFRA